MKIGDIVTISPAHSLKFAGRKGEIVKIVHEDGLPVKIKFNSDRLYGFSPEEIKEWFNV